jgi:hypothetical protein
MLVNCSLKVNITTHGRSIWLQEEARPAQLDYPPAHPATVPQLLIMEKLRRNQAPQAPTEAPQHIPHRPIPAINHRHITHQHHIHHMVRSAALELIHSLNSMPNMVQTTLPPTHHKDILHQQQLLHH